MVPESAEAAGTRLLPDVVAIVGVTLFGIALLSSTALNVLVMPAMFLRFGAPASR